MTDDANSTDDNLADPAQVVPREPRSPVEAAADPAHGGGMPGAFGDFRADDHPKADASPRTIVSGVERLMQIAKGSRFLVNDLDRVVGALTGRTEGEVVNKWDGGVMGTADSMHGALDVIEEAMGRLVAMTMRAKAAHG